MSTQEKLGKKDYLGTTLLSAGPSITDAFISSYFMVYMTDYAGMGSWAAAMAGTVLIIARIFDFLWAPAVGIIVGRSKPGHFGKFRPFLALSVCLASAGVLLLFHMPEAVSRTYAAAFAFALFAYLIYDIGSSFYMPTLLYRAQTQDTAERGKLLIGPRYMSVGLGITMSAFITGAGKLNKIFGSMHRSVGVMVSAYVIPTLLVSLLGIAIVRERHVVTDEAASRVRFRDIAVIFKENAAFRIRTLSVMFSGFVWTFLFSSLNYYLKWCYCADLSTGAVDGALYGRLIVFSSLLTVLPILIGSAVAAPLMQRAGSPDRFARILLLIQAIPLGLIFVLQMLGIVQRSFILFFCLVGVAAFAIGCNFMPENVMAMESMDYDMYVNGKDRGPIYHTVGAMIGKIQTTASSVGIAAILTSIGYVVDARTDTFLGDMARMPGMLTKFTVMLGLIPAALSLVAFLILLRYPVTNEIREKMR